MALTDQDILSDVQSLVAEPLDGGATWPSDMWTASEVLDILDGQQQSLLKATGLVMTRATIGCIPNLHRHELPEDYVALQRVAWKRASDGRIYVLNRADVWQLDMGRSSWRTEPGIPELYTDADMPSRTVRIAPASSAIGTLLITYLALPTLFAGGTAAEVPDDTTVGLVWGTIADMLSKEGRARDPARAQIAAQRATLVHEAVKLILQGREI